MLYSCDVLKLSLILGVAVALGACSTESIDSSQAALDFVCINDEGILTTCDGGVAPADATTACQTATVGDGGIVGDGGCPPVDCTGNWYGDDEVHGCGTAGNGSTCADLMTKEACLLAACQANCDGDCVALGNPPGEVGNWECIDGMGGTVCVPPGMYYCTCDPDEVPPEPPHSWDCPPPCGDAICDPGETNASCPEDCPPSCGDGVCNGTETPASCPADCPPVCGDGSCDGDETHETCPDDCPPSCGDGVCNGDEEPSTCPEDCPPVCGDGSCDGDETNANCPDDCPPVCGDGACNGDETPDTCPEDCPAICGDGLCEGGETYEICPEDCPPVCSIEPPTFSESVDLPGLGFSLEIPMSNHLCKLAIAVGYPGVGNAKVSVFGEAQASLEGDSSCRVSGALSGSVTGRLVACGPGFEQTNSISAEGYIQKCKECNNPPNYECVGLGCKNGKGKGSVAFGPLIQGTAALGDPASGFGASVLGRITATTGANITLDKTIRGPDCPDDSCKDCTDVSVGVEPGWKLTLGGDVTVFGINAALVGTGSLKGELRLTKRFGDCPPPSICLTGTATPAVSATISAGGKLGIGVSIVLVTVTGSGSWAKTSCTGQPTTSPWKWKWRYFKPWSW